MLAKRASLGAPPTIARDPIFTTMRLAVSRGLRGEAMSLMAGYRRRSVVPHPATCMRRELAGRVLGPLRCAGGLAGVRVACRLRVGLCFPFWNYLGKLLQRRDLPLAP